MYITATVGNKPPKQLSFEELFSAMLSTNWMSSTAYPERQPHYHKPYTRTQFFEVVPERLIIGCPPERLIAYLKDFNERWSHLIGSDLSKHYSRFYIPKKSGGLRPIDNPDSEISTAHVELRTLFETQFYASHHAAAYAYVSGRSTVDAVKQHQRNESKWILKTDISGFFPNTTLDFVMNMLAQIFPFGLVCADEEGRKELRKALSICFLNGGLPMGTKISPMLTNLIMIPFDYELSKYLRQCSKPEQNSDGVGRRFVYTRYADDLHISCGIHFDQRTMLAAIGRLFTKFNAPYTIKDEKTHYGSTSGRNWILGVMLNKDNRITIGHKKRRNIEAMVFNYMQDGINNIRWDLDQLQYLQGLLSYYKMVDEVGCNALLAKYDKKFSTDVMAVLKADLRAV